MRVAWRCFRVREISRREHASMKGGFLRYSHARFRVSTPPWASSLPSRLIYTACTNVLSSFTANWNKVFPVYRGHQSITTQASVEENEVTRAFEEFLSSVKEHSISMKEMCSIYIEKLCRSGKLQDAVYLLRHLHNRHISLRLGTHNILLTASSEANNFDFFSVIFKNLLLSSLPPDLISYINVAKAFEKVSDSDLLLKFVREVSEITIHRDPTVMNRIIFILGKSGQINIAIMIFEHMKNLKCKIDAVTFNTALVILGKGGQVDRMLCEFTLMKELGYTPDIVTYNTLINCLRRLGRLDLCLVFLREMSERGIELDLRTYTAIIDSFGRAGLVDDGLRVFGEMRKNQVRPSIYVYRALISDLKKAGKFDLAHNFLEEMNSSAFKLVGPEDFKQKKSNG